MDLVKKPPTSILTIIITIIIVTIGLVVVYFLYKFVYGSSSLSGVQIIKAQVPANIAHPNLPSISGLYEGGDYAVSAWIYINSYNINRNTRKHVLEIGGANFSTLLIALGAFKNTLSVRTHSRDSESVVVGGSNTNPSASQAPPSTSTALTAPATTTTSTSSSTSSTARQPSSGTPSSGSMPPGAVTSFYDANGVKLYFNANGQRLGASGNIISNTSYDAAGNMIDADGDIIQTAGSSSTGYNSQTVNDDALRVQFAREIATGVYPAAENNPVYSHYYNSGYGSVQGFQNATPNSSDATRQDGSLTARDLDAMFTPLAMDDSLLNPTQICDIPVIDMQRWVNITVVLSGRTIDVYMDGKLVRSCLTPSYYKVDPTGVKIKVTERGGFDGYVNGISMYNYPLSPADIYHIYQAGPTGTAAGVGTLVISLIAGEN